MKRRTFIGAAVAAGLSLFSRPFKAAAAPNPLTAGPTVRRWTEARGIPVVEFTWPQRSIIAYTCEGKTEVLGRLSRQWCTMQAEFEQIDHIVRQYSKKEPHHPDARYYVTRLEGHPDLALVSWHDRDITPATMEDILESLHLRYVGYSDSHTGVSSIPKLNDFSI